MGDRNNSWAEWSYNTSHHSSINTNLFEALYDPRRLTILFYFVGSSLVDAMDVDLVERDKSA